MQEVNLWADLKDFPGKAAFINRQLMLRANSLSMTVQIWQLTADKTPKIFHVHFHLIPGMCLGLYVEAHSTQSSETAKQNQIKLV